jgi:hypothetical protein
MPVIRKDIGHSLVFDDADYVKRKGKHVAKSLCNLRLEVAKSPVAGQT